MAPVPATTDSSPSLYSIPPVLAMLAVIPFVYVGYRVFRYTKLKHFRLAPIRTLFALLHSIAIYLIAPFFYSPDLTRYINRWTVVTGGTDGIGKAYTIELARRGLRKFVLIGRNQEKLSDVKTLLELSFGCRVKTYLFDFAKDDFEQLREYISNIDVGFVVNSVGVGRENLERYGDNPAADRQILKINGLGAAEFLSIVLPAMEKAGGGQIVVLSSSQGYRPIPLLAAYSASKAVMSFLCEAIDREYKTISVQCLTPALIATKMVYYTKGGLFVVTPEQFAKQAVNTIGLTSKTSGCFNHEIQVRDRSFIFFYLFMYCMCSIYVLYVLQTSTRNRHGTCRSTVKKKHH
ncbi:oxidoreductase, short chain dehydrogenase/reductase family protein [Ancylostoma duodenale]|uniref:Oxidoreductase, short chain dehydrogenase/reductase family protein n=1 Tax=Ancylostoma duodenale TaxID=51022 RepID=A0A0C2GGL9_9BILA|nr:oxidoreductase, short chain dehydrogenase/reductase family protein [Ancylostoma duodenale]